MSATTGSETTTRSRKTTATVVRNFSLLLALSIQVGLNPILTKWYAATVTNIGLRVAVIECMKLVIAIICLSLDGTLRTQLSEWNFALAMRTTFIPSLVYALQNGLNQHALDTLDGVTFNILNQTKILSTAFCVYWVLGKRPSREQAVALVLLLVSAILLTKRSHGATTTPSLTMTTMHAQGTVEALVAAGFSGIAGTMIQHSMQHRDRNNYMVTMELSVFGLAGVVFFNRWSWLLFQRLPHDADDLVFSMDEDVWHGWTWATWLVMACQAAGGVVVGLVIKFTGTVEKNFAVVAGVMLTALIESRVNHEAFGFTGCLSITLVATSSYLYAKYPPTIPVEPYKDL